MGVQFPCRAFLIVAAILTASYSPYTTSDPITVSRPSASVGTDCVYDVLSFKSGEKMGATYRRTVKRIENGVMTVEVSHSDGRRVELNYTPEWNLIGGGFVDFNPARIDQKFPLAEGKGKSSNWGALENRNGFEMELYSERSNAIRDELSLGAIRVNSLRINAIHDMSRATSGNAVGKSSVSTWWVDGEPCPAKIMDQYESANGYRVIKNSYVLKQLRQEN